MIGGYAVLNRKSRGYNLKYTFVFLCLCYHLNTSTTKPFQTVLHFIAGVNTGHMHGKGPFLSSVNWYEQYKCLLM